MTKFECPRCGYTTSAVAVQAFHPCPKRSQGDHRLVELTPVETASTAA